MNLLKLSQITEVNNTLNTTSLSKFDKRVEELENNIQEFIDDGLNGDFNKMVFNLGIRELSYYVNNMNVLSDDEYEQFEKNETQSFLNEQK